MASGNSSETLSKITSISIISLFIPINKQVIDVERIPPKPVEATPEPEQRSGCGNMIAGGIAVCAAMAVAFVVLKKKED